MRADAVVTWHRRGKELGEGEEDGGVLGAFGDRMTGGVVRRAP